jgi:hypothetical protein
MNPDLASASVANPSAKIGLIRSVIRPSELCQQLCQQPCPFLPFSANFSHLEGAETIEFWSTSGNQQVEGSIPSALTIFKINHLPESE